MQLPLGIRQNNPGNIEKNPRNAWQGRVDTSSGRFETFKSAEWGIRAMVRILYSYLKRDKDGALTIAEIIEQWAPPNENDTKGYAKFVATSVGKKPDEPVNMHDAAEIAAIVKAKIRMENGNPRKWGREVWYPDEVIMQGVQMGMAR